MDLPLPHPVSDSLRRADVYPVGVVFDVVFDAFRVRLTTLPDDHIRFDIAEGPYARTEAVRIAATPIRAGVFAVSWVEADGATVVHVEDFERAVVHSYATLPNGSFLRMQGQMHFISQQEGQR
ncbi:MAG: hypothetical protein KIT83_06325 [Bryobacterales bacterium]|nr:hypothetical protein [Bryobacterales bacterium]